MLDTNSAIELKNKILILYIINHFSVPLTNQQLSDFILEENIMNYFELQQFVSDLEISSMLEYSKSEDDKFYVITIKGTETLDLFLDQISQYQRRDLNDAIDCKKKSFVAKTNIYSDYHKLDDDDYEVELVLKEGGSTLIDMKINVLSNKHAKDLCENWNQKALYMYGDVLALLLNKN